jgi:HD-like signal output (HDOD) protein
VDLDQVAAFLRQDPGAVARVFHYAADQYAASEVHLTRLEDCVSNIGIQACLNILADSVVLPSSQWTVLCRICEHSVEIAERCMRIAAETQPFISEEDAYQVGLFHELDELLGILTWESKLLTANDPDDIALSVAGDWGLPEAVSQYFRERKSTYVPPMWTMIVEKAHLALS